MTPAERRALLGDEVIAHIRKEVAAAPPPSAGVIASLRPILTSRPPVITDRTAVSRPAGTADRPAA
ncbi:hypothetical protein ACFW1M_11580 [Streptomyces inhibens]|uniref:hypothetical protein n=1 Tax=Streptomyces inhibens TaxID=2293571 RepID=UPI0036A8C3D5